MKTFGRKKSEQKFEPLWFMLAKELKFNDGPMPRERLISMFEIQRGHEQVVQTINMLIEAGLIVEEPVLFSDGQGTFYANCLRLPLRSVQGHAA